MFIEIDRVLGPKICNAFFKHGLHAVRLSRSREEGLEYCKSSKISTHRLLRPFEKILKKYMSAKSSSEQT